MNSIEICTGGANSISRTHDGMKSGMVMADSVYCIDAPVCIPAGAMQAYAQPVVYWREEVPQHHRGVTLEASLILARASQAGRLAQMDALTTGRSIETARITGHSVTTAHLVLAVDELVVAVKDLLSGRWQASAVRNANAVLARAGGVA